MIPDHILKMPEDIKLDGCKGLATLPNLLRCLTVGRQVVHLKYQSTSCVPLLPCASANLRAA